MGFTKTLLTAATLALALGSGGAASAGETKLMAMMSGSDETPPAESEGIGMANVIWNSDTKELSWTIEFSGLSGPATAAHFHGPAAPGEKAGVQVPIPDVESPSEGSATLTDEQAADLAAGKYYVNIHTAKYRDGEIRGQVVEGSM